MLPCSPFFTARVSIGLDCPVDLKIEFKLTGGHLRVCANLHVRSTKKGNVSVFALTQRKYLSHFFSFLSMNIFLTVRVADVYVVCGCYGTPLIL